MGDPNSAVPEHIAAAVAWADAVLDGGGHVDPTNPLLDRLGAAFTAEELVELTYAIGTFAGYSKLIVILGLEWDENMSVIEIPTPGA